MWRVVKGERSMKALVESAAFRRDEPPAQGRENRRYVRMSDMKKDDVKAVLGRVLTWPAEAQKEAVATLRAIEEEWVSGDYNANSGGVGGDR